MQEEIIFSGHPNVQSFHPRTIEITKAEQLTPRGDCIIGVRATKSCSDLDPALKNQLMKSNSCIVMEIVVRNDVYTVTGSGDEWLTLKNTHDIVIRKTNFVCPRTLSIRCDRASSDIPRDMVEALKDPSTKGLFRITVE